MTNSSLTQQPIGLPPAIVGWIVNHAAKNYWRVADWYELDDLVQDGLMVAYKCRERYGADIDPPHFMALVKTAFYRHITETLRHSRAEQTQVVHVSAISSDMSEAEFLDRAAEPAYADYDLIDVLADMPGQLRRAVMAYLDNKKHRVSLNEDEAHWLKRLSGFPLRHDFETVLRDYLRKHQAA